MRWVLERVSGPDIEPVTLAEAKRHLREYQDVTDNDADIEALIVGAREWAEDYTDRALVDQEWRLTFGDSSRIDPVVAGTLCGEADLRGTEIYLRKSPAISIVSFVTVAADGTETAVDPTTYELREADGRGPRVVALTGASWTSGIYRIVFRAGFANRALSPQEGAEVVPERFKTAIRLWVEAMYDRDDRMMPVLLKTAEGLLRAERVEMGFA